MDVMVHVANVVQMLIVESTNDRIQNVISGDVMSAEKGQIVKSVILQTPNAIFARFIIYFYRNK